VRCFVTGATGFIGGRLVRSLVRDGHQVHALVREPAAAQDLDALGVTLHRGDVRDRSSVLAAMRGAEAVYHVAAWYQVGRGSRGEAEAINVQGTRHVLEAMRELQVPRGVYTSTIALNSDTKGALVDEDHRFEGPFLTVYEETKWRAHYEVALPLIAEGLPLRIVMPSVVYGPGDRGPVRDVLVQYLRGELPVVPAGTTYGWAHVDDIVQGHRLAFDRGRDGRSYILCGPVHALEQMLAMVRPIAGGRAPLPVPAPLLRGLAALTGTLGRVLPVPPTYAGETLRGAAGTTYIASSARARAELGWEPRPLADGLREWVPYELGLLGLRPTGPLYTRDA
jgi:nucleoside-diphosphate-sugar epimerase